MYFDPNGKRISYHRWTELTMQGISELTKKVGDAVVTTRWVGFDLGINPGPARCWETVVSVNGGPERVTGRWSGHNEAHQGHRKEVGIQKGIASRGVVEKMRTSYVPPGP